MDNSYYYLVLAFLFGCLCVLMLLFYRTLVYNANETEDIGNLLMSLEGEGCESYDDAAARVLKMTPAEFKIERRKGNALFIIGSRLCGVSESLKSPIRWR